ncbi:MAG TPA: FixH family protein [Acetobacteraceae bacterium]|nr:FixH family protein [Acetobacteraceae bacterium]
MVSKHTRTGAALLGIGLGASSGCVGSSPAQAAPQDYRFELAGKPQSAGSGKEVVPVRLVHVPDNKLVTDAVVFESKADMGPAGMPTMTAPIKPLPTTQPGVYRFEVEPGMAGAWAITLVAKVQGEAGTVRGSVTTDLAK